MEKVGPIPDVLPVRPVVLACLCCKAKPGKDCATSLGGFAVVNVARIAAALARDLANKRKP